MRAPFVTRLLPLMLLLLSVVGCGRVHQTHWVDGPFNDPSVRGFWYDRLYLAPDAAEAIAGRRVLVKMVDPYQTIDWTRSKVTDPIDWVKWRDTMEKYLADRLWQSRVFADVSATTDELPLRNPDLVLRVAITEFHEGNAFLRYLPGFGAGATRLQWEAELSECEAGSDRPVRRIFAFADARLHPGGPYFGISTKPYYGQRLLIEDLDFAITALVKDLRRLTDTRDRELDRETTHPTAPAHRQLAGAAGAR